MKYIQILVYILTTLFAIQSCNNHSKQNPLTVSPYLQDKIDSLDSILTTISKESIIPGFVATINQGNRTIYSKGFGYSDLANEQKFTTQTIHTLASVSKTVVGIAIMKLVEDGKLKLDDPINDYLPYSITSPHFPEKPITIRHLVTHTSSLNDDYDEGEKRPSELKEQPKYSLDEMPEEMIGDIHYWDGTFLPLEEYINRIFTPTGMWYAKSNFSNFEPGKKYEYSNEGTNLAGLIVEQISGISFSEFTQKHVFQPLNMTNTYWEYTDLKSTVSKWYTVYEVDSTSQLFEFPRANESGQPCGDLKSNANDLSKYMIEITNGFNGIGKILNPESYQTLLNPQQNRDIFEETDDYALNDDYDVGVFWAISQPGYRLHKGGSIGVLSLLYFNPNNDISVISFCNLAHADFGKVVNTIMSFEEKLSK